MKLKNSKKKQAVNEENVRNLIEELEKDLDPCVMKSIRKLEEKTDRERSK